MFRFPDLDQFIDQRLRGATIIAAKILTDPFHNIHIYWRSRWALMCGERVDPIEPHEHERPAEV